MGGKITYQSIEKLGSAEALFRRKLEAEAEWLASKYNKDAVTELPNRIFEQLISREGHRIPIEEAELIETISKDSIYQEQDISALIQQYLHKHYLSRNAYQQIEVSDNSLAKTIRRKLDLDSEIIRRAEAYVHNAYNGYLTTSTLLDKEGLAYIKPHESKMLLSHEERGFIAKSKNKRRRDNIRQYVFLLAIIGFLMLLVIGLWQQRRQLRRANADKEMLNQELADKNTRLSDQNFSLDSINRAKERINLELISTRDSLAGANQDLLALKLDLEAALDSLIRSNQEVRRLQVLSEDRADSLSQFADSLQSYVMTLQQKNEIINEQNTQIIRYARQTEDLKNVAITRNVANDILQLGDQNAELKAKLASTIYAFNKDLYGGDIYHPSILRALHNTINSLGFETFQEVDADEGGVRKLLNTPGQDTAFYVSTGFGSVHKCQTETWSGIELPDLHCEDILPMQDFPVQHLTAVGDEYCVIGGLSDKLVVWSAKSREHFSVRFPDMTQIVGICPLTSEECVLVYVNHENGSELVQYHFDTGESTHIHSFAGKVTSADISDQGNTIILGFEDRRIMKTDLHFGISEEILQTESLPTCLKALRYPDIYGTMQSYLAIGMASGSFQIIDLEDRQNIVYQKQSIPGVQPVYHYGESKFHEARISEIVVSPDNQYLGVGSFDGKVTFWNLKKCLQVRERSYLPMQFDNPASWVYAILFSNDSKKVLVAEGTGIHTFCLDPDIYIKAICDQVSGALSTEELELYFGPEFPKIETCQK